MKPTIVAVTFAIGSAACAGQSHPPAQAATSTSVTYESPEPGYYSAPTAAAPAATTGATQSPSTGSTSMMGNGSTPTPQATPAPVVAPEPAPSVRTSPSDTNTVAPDNTKVNTRDRSGTLTPIDQGNSKPEIAITASIRKAVMGDRALSFTAKNVKIITVGTKVTLRGPVKSDTERTEIENLARQTAGVTDVDNQLEVKN